MPKYTFTNDFPQVFGDLYNGVNATVEGGSTAHGWGCPLELTTGDVIITDAPYEHPFLQEVITAPTKAKKAATAVSAPIVDASALDAPAADLAPAADAVSVSEATPADSASTPKE